LTKCIITTVQELCAAVFCRTAGLKGLIVVRVLEYGFIKEIPSPTLHTPLFAKARWMEGEYKTIDLAI
jgi:hypothetical protein